MIKPIPKLRGKTTGRPRPKTIHVDTGSVELAEGMLTPSRGKKGSTSNLSKFCVCEKHGCFTHELLFYDFCVMFVFGLCFF